MNKQILFIDDEPEYINMHKDALTRAGYFVTNAYTYEEACDKLKISLYDLIILDLIISNDGEIPDIDNNEPDFEVGLRLHRKIREEMRIRIPILFFTVVINDHSIFQRILNIEKKSGFIKYNYLSKPQLPSRLVLVIKNIIG